MPAQPSDFKAWAVGTGRLEGLRCVLEPVREKQYSDAQVTDYQGLPRRAFPWHPPVRLTVRAWASHPTNQLKGTAGFGFWNDPVGHSLPRLPRTAWFFFGSPPGNIAVAKDVPGYGWKAATFDARRWPALLLFPLAPIGFLLMRVPALYRRLWPIGQWAIGVSERVLPVDLSEMHVYELDWLRDRVLFRVDGEPVHKSPHAPKGPLGFIAWMDNQYAGVTPQGRFRWGVLKTDQQQWLALAEIKIQPI